MITKDFLSYYVIVIAFFKLFLTPYAFLHINNKNISEEQFTFCPPMFNFKTLRNNLPEKRIGSTDNPLNLGFLFL